MAENVSPTFIAETYRFLYQHAVETLAEFREEVREARDTRRALRIAEREIADLKFKNYELGMQVIGLRFLTEEVSHD